MFDMSFWDIADGGGGYVGGGGYASYRGGKSDMVAFEGWITDNWSISARYLRELAVGVPWQRFGIATGISTNGDIPFIVGSGITAAGKIRGYRFEAITGWF
jgi:hypothetical protein